MLAYINYPSWLTPSVFGFLNLSQGNPILMLRWYPISYLLAFGLSYLINSYLVKVNKFPGLDKKFMSDIYFWGVIGLVLGARIGYCLIYEPGYYITHLHEIIIPFRGGKFTGFQGMSFHGGVAGTIITAFIMARKRKVSFAHICDTFVPGLPLGYTFGRLGNFANAELYGRITAHPIGMLFPNAQKLPVKLSMVKDVMQGLGWRIGEERTIVTATGEILDGLISPMSTPSGIIEIINLPRHPSQLYESLLEGLVLFLIMWFVIRRFKLPTGFMLPVFIVGYSIARFSVEFFRQPDMLYSDFASGKYTGTVVGGLTMGHMLSIFYVSFAIGLAIWFYIQSKKPVKSDKFKKRKR